MKRKILNIFLSAIIAFGLWVYVINVVSPEFTETFYNIPVVYEGQNAMEDRGFMITSGMDTRVSLKLKGNRSDINKLSSDNITVKVDLSKISEAGLQNVSFTVAYPGNLDNDDISVEERNPSKITLRVEQIRSKEVPIKVVYKGDLPENYISDKVNAVTNYTSVLISGPSPVVDQIREARIEVDLTGRTQSISENFRYTLCDENGQAVDAENVETNVEDVRLELKIQRIKEIPLQLTVVPGGGATRENTTVQQSITSIHVSGSEAALEGLDMINLGTINLAGILENTTLTIPIELPGNVTNHSGVHEVQITIKFSNLEKKTFTAVTAFQATDVPEGMEAEILTKTVTVTLRGPKKLLNQIKEDDIIAVVSFAGADVGTAKMLATIQLPEGFEAVGAVGICEVSATLRAHEVDPNGAEG